MKKFLIITILMSLLVLSYSKDKVYKLYAALSDEQLMFKDSFYEDQEKQSYDSNSSFGNELIREFFSVLNISLGKNNVSFIFNNPSDKIIESMFSDISDKNKIIKKKNSYIMKLTIIKKIQDDIWLIDMEGENVMMTISKNKLFMNSFDTGDLFLIFKL